MKKLKYNDDGYDDWISDADGITGLADGVELYLASEVDARIAELEVAAQKLYSRRQLEARIAQLELALHQIKNGCVDEDDEANALWRSSPREIRKIAVNALNGHTD
jgi:hypothetical protein